jgi:uncharacterized membrane protein (DUF4010 family)
MICGLCGSPLQPAIATNAVVDAIRKKKRPESARSHGQALFLKATMGIALCMKLSRIQGLVHIALRQIHFASTFVPLVLGVLAALHNRRDKLSNAQTFVRRHDKVALSVRPKKWCGDWVINI